MKVNIIVPYRPLTTGSRVNPLFSISQLKDGRWEPSVKDKFFPKADYGRQDLYRAIHYINKNSSVKHNIIIAIDSDVFPNDTWLKNYDNVTWIKSDYVIDYDSFKDKGAIAMCRMAAADMAGINSVPDDEWICYAFIEDLIPAKEWDVPIIEAIIEHGDNYVYVPMFVECHGGIHGVHVKGMTATPDLIWNVWRKTQSCHALLLPEPANGFVTEEDFDNWIQSASQGNMPKHVTEPCGVRNLGYYAVMFMKAKVAKQIGIKIANGFDTDFDGRLYVQGGYTKVVVTSSFVLHPYGNAKFPFPGGYVDDTATQEKVRQVIANPSEVPL